MTDLSARPTPAAHQTTRRLRFVTAASLFDGHDASINIIRRMLQASGAEVIHLGHNRSVDEIVTAALQEDAHGIAVSSYQGGHIEFFKYMIDLLRERGGENIKVFGGGGGVIVPAEIARAACLRRHAHLLARGRRPDGPAGHDRRHARACDAGSVRQPAHSRSTRCSPATAGRSPASSPRSKAAALPEVDAQGAAGPRRAAREQCPCSGVTGTGGSGKSSLTDELIRRFRLDQDDRLKHRRDRGRSVAPQDRRRAAGRPHPDERDQ